jgi:hypothetical protein
MNDAEFARRWNDATRYYLLTDKTQLARLAALVGANRLHQVAESGGKFLFTNSAAGTASNRAEAKDNGSL